MVRFVICLLILLIWACSDEKELGPANPTKQVAAFRGVDLSALPEIEVNNPVFYNRSGEAEAILPMLKKNGVNTIRLRLWHRSSKEYATYEAVRDFAKSLQDLGFEICLAIHYSDTWADPAQQALPSAWQNLSFSDLTDSLSIYTAKVISEIKPEYVQIGNEINAGFLFPHGNIQTAESQFLSLINTAVNAVRTESNSTKIILHFAGFEGANWFFDKFRPIDYDIIGLSYYPIWHGKSIDLLGDKLSQLHQDFQKTVLIAETAYPFSLAWNDLTHNIVGLESQLILPTYPASPIGQQQFLSKINAMVLSSEGAIGFCYWGGELIAFKGPQATDGSVWENQALFDFDQHALPALEVFRTE